MAISKMLAAAAVVVALPFAAQAADAALPYEDVPYEEAAVFSWEGFYAGLHAGYGSADRDWNGTGMFDTPIDDRFFQYDMTGALLGGQVGYNWQKDNWVFGVEADVAWSNMDDFLSESPFLATYDVDSEVEWLATVRGRVGFAWDRILLYGTGGVAFAGVDTKVTGDFSQTDKASATHTGWVLGVGAEAMVTQKISVKLEYLHADFGKEDYNYNLYPGPTTNETNGRADLDLDMVRLGVNFHF